MSELQGNYFHLFSRKSTLIYPHDAIVSAVKAYSPRVDSVLIKRDGLHGLIITVNEKAPVAIVCGDLPDLGDGSIGADSPDDCYFTDEDGLLFEKIGNLTSGDYAHYYAPSLDGGSSGQDLSGTYATSTAEFRALQSFYSGVQSAGLTIQGVLIGDGGEYEMYADNPDNQIKSVSTTTPSTVIIYFNDSKPFSSQLADLSAFWSSMVAKANNQEQLLKFDSIDVRYGPNVFYRLEGGKSSNK